MDPLWSETCWSTFKYFIILIVSTYYILCISWIVKCLTWSYVCYVNIIVKSTFVITTKSPQYHHKITIKSPQNHNITTNSLQNRHKFTIKSTKITKNHQKFTTQFTQCTNHLAFTQVWQQVVSNHGRWIGVLFVVCFSGLVYPFVFDSLQTPMATVCLEEDRLTSP